jgi:hypothetical protein|tara:strand:- start:259 stop:432 length:174 start_codon:yes stop_codon:yes gene_type:complete
MAMFDHPHIFFVNQYTVNLRSNFTQLMEYAKLTMGKINFDNDNRYHYSARSLLSIGA